MLETSTQQEVRPAAPAAAASPSRFVFADALRGIAAMGVVLCHAYGGGQMRLLEERLPAPVFAFFRAGHLGVPIFFVLSGFVISYSVARYRVDARFVGRFALRRSLRLDPPYWMSIVLVLGLAYFSQFFIPGRSFQFPSTTTLAAHLCYVQGFAGIRNINPVYWTLCLEIQFYLVFCILLGVAHRFRRDESDRRSLRAIFVAAALVAAAWPSRIIPVNPYPGLFLEMWFGFLLGVAACWAMQKVIPSWWFYLYAGLIGLASAWHADTFGLTCVVTAILLAEAARRGKLAVWLNSRALLFLGTISYSLYLVHNPVIGAFYRLAYKITGRSVFSEVFWFLPMIAVTVAAAFAFWWLFERTSLGMSRCIRLDEPLRTRPAERLRPEPVPSISGGWGIPERLDNALADGSRSS